MRILITYVIVLGLFFSSNANANMAQQYHPESIPPETLQDYNNCPDKVRDIIAKLLDLARQNITYQYGSADPSNGGMDCSGTIHYVLIKMGIKNVPHSSYSLYQWVNDKGRFYAVKTPSFTSPEFAQLKPGDLLFWSGTYQTNNQPNVSHVMIYIGRNKQGDLLMVGASDGRTYKGRKIYGVSVFDFKLPSSTSKSKFLGYSCIPEISCAH
jgi:cell wall-associated NlpC family hydrolase